MRSQVRNMQNQGHVSEGTEYRGDDDIICEPRNRSPIDIGMTVTLVLMAVHGVSVLCPRSLVGNQGAERPNHTGIFPAAVGPGLGMPLP